MRGSITKRQKQLLEIIYKYIKNAGYPPTFEEMRGELGVSSNQSVIDLINKLKARSFIKKAEGARSLSILPLGYDILGRPPLVAFLGVTSAGAPIETIEITGDWQEIPSAAQEKLSVPKQNIFALRVMGDSMINAGIQDGDIVLVQEKKEFSSGDVVLAQIGDESTIKRFISEDKPPYVYLKPENPKYPIIPFTDEMELKGKVISVVKNNYWKPVK